MASDTLTAEAMTALYKRIKDDCQPFARLLQEPKSGPIFRWEAADLTVGDSKPVPFRDATLFGGVNEPAILGPGIRYSTRLEPISVNLDFALTDDDAASFGRVLGDRLRELELDALLCRFPSRLPDDEGVRRWFRAQWALRTRKHDQ